MRSLFAAALLAACAATAYGQKPIARIGVLTLGVSPSSPFVEAFRQGMRELGYGEGRGVAYEYRFAEGRLDRLPALAQELVRSNVSVIVTESTQAALSAKQASGTMPIVMAATALDPVKAGLIASLNKPGGNVTGLLLFGPALDTKRMQLFRDSLPERRTVAAIVNAASPNAPERIPMTVAAARALGLELKFVEVRAPADLDAAFQAIERLKPSALITISDGMLLGQRARIVEFAARQNLPGIFPERQFADAGALMAYGVNIEANFRRAAAYVDKILKGARPADLPVEEPARIDFVVNLKAAAALGVTIPASVLMLADEVIR